MTPERFHTSSVGADEAALRAALSQCSALMQERNGSVMGLAVHGKKNLEGVVRIVLGDSAVRVLDRDNRQDLKGVTTYLLTEKVQLRKLDGPVLAAFIDPCKLDRVVSSAGVTGIVFVPWAQEDLPAYLAAYPASKEIFRAACLDQPVAKAA